MFLVVRHLLLVAMHLLLLAWHLLLPIATDLGWRQSQIPTGFHFMHFLGSYAAALARGASSRLGAAGWLAVILFLVANIVTTSKALVTRSDALVPSSILLLLVGGCSSFVDRRKPTVFEVDLPFPLLKSERKYPEAETSMVLFCTLSTSGGPQPNCEGLQPNSDGRQSNSDGLQANSDCFALFL